MFQIEIVKSADPVLKLLRSRPHEIFAQPFAGYAICLFGAADDGVAEWFARSVCSIDSVTDEDIACVVFAKRAHIRGTISRFESPRPRRSARRDGSGTYDLATIRHEDVPAHIEHIADRLNISVTRLVNEMQSVWRPTDQELTVSSYAVDEIASKLSVLSSIPCIVFFDAVLSATPTLEDVKSQDLAVLPLQDNPGPEVIRFLRRVIQRFRNSSNFKQYVESIRTLINYERDLESYIWRCIEPVKKAIEEAEREHQAQLERLAAFKALLPIVVAGASSRGLRKGLCATPEIPPGSFQSIETKIVASKSQLIQLSKTLSTLEYYIRFEDWPLSATSTERLSAVMEKHVKTLLPDIKSRVIAASREGCEEALSQLRRLQSEVVNAILVNGPNLQELETRTTIDFRAKVASLHSALRRNEAGLDDLSKRLETCRKYCTAPDRPSIVKTVIEELNVPTATAELPSGSACKPVTVIIMPNARVGDSYTIHQAGAVGPGAAATNMTFVTERESAPSEKPDRE